MMEVTLQIEVVECAVCGLPFGITQHFERQRRADHANFWCPSGHTNHYPGETDEERLRKKLAQAQHCCDQERARATDLAAQLSHAENRVRGYQGALAKEKKRQPKRIAAQAGPDAG